MVMTPEGKVKMAVKKILKQHNAYFFMPLGQGFGRAGVPDIIACLNGSFLGIECKAGNNTTTPMQDIELAAIKQAGGIALVVREDTKELEKICTRLEEGS